MWLKFLELGSEGPDSSGSEHNLDKGQFVLFSFENTSLCFTI